MFHLIAAGRQDLLPHLIVINVVHHPLRIEMRELHRQCLEGVSLRDMIFYSSLEFLVGEGLPRNTFEFVVGKC